MGVDTDGKIKVDHGVKDIQRVLRNKFKVESTIHDTGMKDYYQLTFKYNDENRMLNIFENYVDDETKEVGTHLSLGMWGSSIELMKGIIENFGGFIKENDCSDEWEYVPVEDRTLLTEDEILEDKLLEAMKDFDLNFVQQQQLVHFVKKNLNFIKAL